MGLGFKSTPKQTVAPQVKDKTKHQAKRQPDAPAKVHPKPSSDFDLAKAFALRQKEEQRLREQAEMAKQEQARQRKLQKEQVAQLLKDQVQNRPDADIVRHFPYAGKIKRVYVTTEQLRAINAGELAVVQHLGKFCIVDKAVALHVQTLIPALLALLCDGNEQAMPEEYADPQFQVPDDLIW